VGRRHRLRGDLRRNNVEECAANAVLILGGSTHPQATARPSPLS